ncbi:hypothetical protein [Coraliomargarita akajimensis]|nr:hypothetical protein [Coraliomargarita akajimensis]
MKNALKRITIGLFAASTLYFGAFYLMGWLAPSNGTINQFYSRHFYKLREWKEREHLKQVERYEGSFSNYADGKARIQYGEGKGISFFIPESLRSQTEIIPDGAIVSANIGPLLDHSSVGIYHYELRTIRFQPKGPIQSERDSG